MGNEVIIISILNMIIVALVFYFIGSIIGYKKGLNRGTRMGLHALDLYHKEVLKRFEILKFTLKNKQ